MPKDTMRETPAIPNEPASGSRRGCSGCLIIALCILVAALGSGLVAYRIARNRLTSPRPTDMSEVHITAPQHEQAQQKMLAIGEAMERGQREQVVLSPADLNALIARETDIDGEKRRLAVDMIDDRIVVDFSLPLDHLPGLGGRHVNGRMDLKIQVRNGVLETYPIALQLNDTAVPEQVMRSLRQRNLAGWIYDNRQAREALRQIETLTVEDGRMIIQTAAHSPGETAE